MVAALVVASIVAASRGDAASPPIVFVVFDELPTVSLLDADGRVDASLYPAFARLAATSTWARGSSTVATRLLEALPAIVTGRMPGPERVRAIRAEVPRTLFSWLEGEYALNVHEPQSRLGPTPLDAAGQALWLEEVRNDRYRGVPQDRFFDGFVASIGEPRAADGRADAPRLDFVHVQLPYAPWRHTASGKTYSPHRLPGNVAERWTGDPELVEDAWRRHLNEVRFADALLGRLLAKLDGLGRLDETLVVVTALYGAGFWPDESRRTPSATRHPEDVLLVPLFVKAPGQRAGRIVDFVVQSTDVLPTVVDAMGREAPWPMDGCSILDSGCPRPASRRVMRLDGSPDGRLVDPYPADLPARRATLERKRALFPDAAVLDRSWPAGRFEAWRSQPAAALPIEEGARAGAWWVDRSARDWRRRAMGGPRLVARVELDAPTTGDGPWVAIALNGRLEAIARAVPDPRGGAPIVRALLPDAALRPGRNALALHLVEVRASVVDVGAPDAGGDARARLVPLERREGAPRRPPRRRAEPSPADDGSADAAPGAVTHGSADAAPGATEAPGPGSER